MARESLNCWHCGTHLDAIPLPIGRREECPHCSSSLHVCRMCDFYDTAASKRCREPMADEVTDKERANFCDYFRPHAGLTADADREAANARAKLAALFGEEAAAKGAESGKPATGEEAAAKRKLDALFSDSKE